MQATWPRWPDLDRILIARLVLSLQATAASTHATTPKTHRTKFFKISSRPLILPAPSYVYPTGSLYHYSIKMCKHVPSHPHTYQKIPDIYLIRSVPLPICTFINCLFVCFFLIVYTVCVLYRHFVSICCCFVTCYCPVLLCYLVSRPPGWIKLLLLLLLVVVQEARYRHSVNIPRSILLFPRPYSSSVCHYPRWQDYSSIVSTPPLQSYSGQWEETWRDVYRADRVKFHFFEHGLQTTTIIALRNLVKTFAGGMSSAWPWQAKRSYRLCDLINYRLKLSYYVI